MMCVAKVFAAELHERVVHYIFPSALPIRPMRQPIRIVITVVLGSACIAGALLVVKKRAQIRFDQSLQHGRYLVESVAICFECHSERDYTDRGWPIPKGRVGGGRILVGEGTASQLIAPNISPDRDTGLGSWSDEEIMRAIRDGVAPDGHLLNPEMPSRYFHSLSEGDLRSIVSYLRSIRPVRHKLPANSRNNMTEPESTILMDSLILANRDPEVLRGAFLVRIAACETCHTPTRDGKYIRGLAFGGGVIFRHGTEMAASTNLTSDPSGISYYDSDRFVEVMRTGTVGARPLMSAMPWSFYRNMTTEDLRSIFAYLRAVPPVSHEVDNSEAPTLCRRCGNLHGLGDHN